MRREASPACDAHQAQAVELSRIVSGDAARQDVWLPRAGVDFKALQLAQRLLQSVFPAQRASRRHVLPAQKPVHELRRGDRLDLLAQRGHGEAVNARQQPAVATLELARDLAE